MRLIAWVASGIVLAGMFLGAGPAVAQTTYQPPKKDGNPVYVEMTRTLNFAEEPADRGRGELPGDFFGGGGGGRRRGGEGGGEGD